MKRTHTQRALGLFTVASIATITLAQTASRSYLGKIDFQALLDAAPGLAATTTEAGSRTYGADILAPSGPNQLATFYAPFEQRLASARAVIQPAVDNVAQDREAIAQRSLAQANASPLISRMGGVEKMAQMSDQELQQAAAQAAGSYQQSLSGAPQAPSGGGMQAMMQRMMSDPAYQERFEKMSKAEQEAEVQKYMGNAQAPPPPPGPTAAERQAAVATNEMGAVIDNQKKLGELMQRLSEIDLEFRAKDDAVLATPGTHDQIRDDIGARIERVPVILLGEVSERDPAQVQPLERERATRDRARATFELERRSALFAQRKARYKQVATEYATWLRQSLGGVNTQTAQLLDDSSALMAVEFEQRLIGAAEELGTYSSNMTEDAAQYEAAYQAKMSEPLVR